MKINLLKITMFFVVSFVISIIVYYIFSLNVYNKFDNPTDIVNYLNNNYELALKLEPIIKQLLLTCVSTCFGLGVIQNIKKLTLNEKNKKVCYNISLSIVIIISILLTITTFYGNIIMYSISLSLMLLILIIWITTIMFDFIKTKNNYQSIFIRISLAILGGLLIITTSYKVTNDYKVNVSIYNSFEYRIEQLESQLPYLDDIDKDVVLKVIEGYEIMQLPMYSNGLIAGKSTFSMYNTLKINYFSSDRLTQTQDAIEQINNLVFNYNNENLLFETYDINPGLYVTSNSNKVIMFLILIVGLICTIKYPLLREEMEEENIEEVITVKFIKDLITKEEFKTLMKKVEK